MIEWAGMNVARSREHENLVKHLVENSETKIFNHNKDLMVFASMIGYANSKRLPLKGSDTIPITLGTYYNTEQDGFIYLLALMTNKNASCLKDDKLRESLKVFEEYCNGGLDLLQDWFRSHPNDIDKLDTLESKLLDQINTNNELYKEINNDDLDVSFD